MTSDEVPPGGFGVELPNLVGKTTNDTTEAATEQGIKTIVVLESVDGMTITPRTMDWVPTRLNLIVERGVVVQAVFG